MRDQKSNQFWQARFAQAFLIFIGIIAILPVVWSIFAGFMIKLIYPLHISLSAILSAGLYMPAFVTASIIGFVIAARSATWGEVTWRFMLATVIIVSLIMYALIYYVHVFGFGDEHFWLWTGAWFFTGIVGYGLLRFSALDQRYQRSERLLLLRSFYIVIIYGLYLPAFYTLFRIAIVENRDDFAYQAGRGRFFLSLEPVALLIAIIIAFGFVAKLRRGKYSISFFFLWPLAVMILFFISQIIVSNFTNVTSWVWFYIVFAVLSIGFCDLLLILLNFGQETNLSLRLHSSNKLKFAMIIFVVLALVAVPLWQSLTIIWRSTLFGMPPASFFMAQIHIAAISGILFFALPCALYAWVKQKIHFGAIFTIALFASVVTSFLPAGRLGVSLGFVFDHLLWQALTFGPIAVIGWYVLSCMPQIKCSLSKI